MPHVAVCSTVDDSFVIFDATNLFDISFKSRISGAGAPDYMNGASAIQIVDNYAYVIAPTDKVFHVIDISNPLLPIRKTSKLFTIGIRYLKVVNEKA